MRALSKRRARRRPRPGARTRGGARGDRASRQPASTTCSRACSRADTAPGRHRRRCSWLAGVHGRPAVPRGALDPRDPRGGCAVRLRPGLLGGSRVARPRPTRSVEPCSARHPRSIAMFRMRGGAHGAARHDTVVRVLPDFAEGAATSARPRGVRCGGPYVACRSRRGSRCATLAPRTRARCHSRGGDRVARLDRGRGGAPPAGARVSVARGGQDRAPGRRRLVSAHTGS